ISPYRTACFEVSLFDQPTDDSSMLIKLDKALFFSRPVADILCSQQLFVQVIVYVNFIVHRSRAINDDL
ncbi:hypothetical protein NQ317_011784, partial [Molorchus minor]